MYHTTHIQPVTTANKAHQYRTFIWWYIHGLLTAYVKLWVADAPRMPRTLSPPPISKESASLSYRHASRASRTYRDACRDRWPAATWNFTYLVRGSWHIWTVIAVNERQPYSICTLSVAYFGNKHMIKNNDSAAHNRDAFDDKIPATSRGAASETLAAAWRFGDI